MGNKTVVVFRVWDGTEDVIALFPGIPADLQGNCSSYEHVGQHGAASYPHVVQNSRPATPKEYADLYAELTLRGYDLDVRKRISQAVRDTFAEEFAEARASA